MLDSHRSKHWTDSFICPLSSETNLLWGFLWALKYVKASEVEFGFSRVMLRKSVAWERTPALINQEEHTSRTALNPSCFFLPQFHWTLMPRWSRYARMGIVMHESKVRRHGWATVRQVREETQQRWATIRQESETLWWRCGIRRMRKNKETCGFILLMKSHLPSRILSEGGSCLKVFTD